MLPDGVTHTKGFLKDPEEPKRYLPLYDEALQQVEEEQIDMDQLENTDNSEDRNRRNGSKIDLTKNVLFPSPYK